MAADAPAGLVSDPCVGRAPIPPALLAAMAARYDTKRTAPPPAVSLTDLAAYRAAEAESQKKDWPNLCMYRAANAALTAGPAAGRQVVFMGDSITQGWGLADADFFAHGWVNRGISGQTTPQMLARFQADVAALKPRAVHIMAGTNDVAGNTGPTSVDAIQNNVIAMVTIAKANHMAVVLASIPPAKAFNWAPTLKPADQIRGLNDWLKTYAAKEGLTYVDYYASLATPDGGMKPELTLDGVHPNAAGYVVMEPLTRAALKRALAR
ncbi:MAG: SGNH/GDSL hydrolase family protein [Alphaproteobacteria bacterium]|nr:SGNH/GDSL hydrolase family protein [Alphaproteobacteria bacterium]MBU1516903.1 SGNH/GDSL hydrolase family protein [Alphaproteobacteria bacterium]MBU2092598.1 SGNH/GDSL hydrolase family protein [Alphaproteobacteria bacterium]MBU2151291.1 SGNH/GDSL hydrolase family protein [Alphaproteobacteria bacterium]MBU2309593.1 SGNH/GDSL hydrolase family protein [Alphaproteobacteria bacterium]